MVISLEMPDAIAKQLHLDGPQSNRRALEMFALEGYRSNELSRGQVSELLGMSFEETERFLKEHHAHIEMTLPDFQRSSEELNRLLSA